MAERRAERDAAKQVKPRNWVGTVTPSQLAFPYLVNWGYPERFYQEASADTATIKGIAGSPGVAEGVARVVMTVDEFDAVRDGDILVCQMTNPAWVVLFTKIAALVTDTGGTTSHPAVLSREFGIPAVIGTSTATHTIRTGDRIRVDGSNGVVEILETRRRRLMPAVAASGRSLEASLPTRSRSGCSRRSSRAAMRPTRGSSRRRWPASSARARRRFAKRFAGSRPSGSSRSPRSGGRGSAVLPDASSWRPTSCARRSRRSRRGSPCHAWATRDLAELADLAEEMQAAAAAGDSHAVAEADARFHGRIVEIADNGTLGKVWRSLEPFSRTYITLVVPGADPQWSADLHTPILRALLERDTDAVVAALERHFDDVAANMARRLPDGTEDETPT